MELRLSENRKIAAAVLVVCILVSIFAFGGGALGRERRKVMKVFNDGTEPGLSVRHSMNAYLDSAAECTQIMANEAEARVGESEAGNTALSNAALIGEDTADLDTRYKAYTDLKGQVEKLYNSLYNAVSAEEFRDFKLAYDDFWGYDDLISHDEYPKYAKRYNELVSGFPGGVVSGLLGLGALNTFGG